MAAKKRFAPEYGRWGAVAMYGDGFAEVRQAPRKAGMAGGGGRRGKISQSMSCQSKVRFSRAVAVMPKTLMPVLVTATLPGDWTPAEGSWSWSFRALDLWLRRTMGADCYFWRREFQARGAPHWHLAVFGVDVEDLKASFAVFWAGLWTEDRMSKRYLDHLRVHRHERVVERARSKDRWRSYLLKDMLKSIQDHVLEEVREAAGGSVGRAWGIMGRGYVEGVRQAVRMRRLNERDAWAAAVWMDRLVRAELRTNRLGFRMHSSMRDACVAFGEWLLTSQRVCPF